MKAYACVLMFCAILVLPIAAQAEYYVAPDGDDGNSGTLASPWRTIQKAVDRALAGTTIYVRAGTYDGQVNVTRSGYSGQYISIENYPGERPVIDGDHTNEYGFNVTGSFIRIKGFEIANLKANPAKSNPRGHVAGIGAYSSNVIIEENVIHDITGGSGRTPYGVIALSRSGGFLIQNNTIHHIGGYAESFGIWAWTAGAIIRQNFVYFCDKTGIRLTTQSYTEPIILRSADNLVEGNITIHNHFGIDLNMAYGQAGKLVARNNFNGWNWGVGIMVKHTQNAIVEHNTFYKNDGFGIDLHGIGSQQGMLERKNVDPIIKNNIMSDNYCGLFIEADPNYQQTFGETVDNNFYYIPASSILGVFKPKGTPYYTIEAFAAASDTIAGLDHTHTPYEQHGLQGAITPFNAADAFDFTLQTGSPAKTMADDGLDAGAVVSKISEVGVDKSLSLSTIPDLHMLPLTLASFSSGTNSGRASYAIDNIYYTWWEIDTVADATREIVLDLPGTDVYQLSEILLSKPDSGENYYYKRFAVYVDDGSGEWLEVAAPAEHPFTGFPGLNNGEIWQLPTQPRARQVKVKIIDGYGSIIRIPDIRLYGQKEEQ